MYCVHMQKPRNQGQGRIVDQVIKDSPEDTQSRTRTHGRRHACKTHPKTRNQDRNTYPPGPVTCLHNLKHHVRIYQTPATRSSHSSHLLYSSHSCHLLHSSHSTVLLAVLHCVTDSVTTSAGTLLWNRLADLHSCHSSRCTRAN